MKEKKFIYLFSEFEEIQKFSHSFKASFQIIIPNDFLSDEKLGRNLKT